jgi:hypothetical protein
LVLINSHDTGCAYHLHAGIYRRFCGNGLLLSDGSFQAIWFRHAGLESEAVSASSFRVLDSIPKVGELVHRLSERFLSTQEVLLLAAHTTHRANGPPLSRPTIALLKWLRLSTLAFNRN